MLIILSTLLIPIFFIPITTATTNPNIPNSINFTINTSEFIWPIPGYTSISSPYGPRNSPTAGASSFHYGIDIPAPQNTNLIAIADGKITFTNFLGAGGYTITLTSKDYKFTYCHVSPNFIVKTGDYINKGDIIGQVGPKYVYNVNGNMYKDSTGKPTNGATTGPHLHFGARLNNKYINPISLFK